MAINKISGNILADDLQRGANLAVQGNLIYFDVTNARVGILTSTPGDDFTVAGTANAANVRITSATANGIFYAASDKLALTTSNLTWNGSTLAVTGNAVIDDISIDGNNISSAANLTLLTSSNGNIALIPNGDGLVTIDTDTGFLLPAGNTGQRPTSVAAGLLRFNTSTAQVEVYDGSMWEGVGNGFAAISDQTITGDGSTVNFTLDQDTYANNIIVSTNGVVQRPGVAYDVTGNLLTFTEAPSVSDIIDVRFVTSLASVNEITNSGSNSIVIDASGVANAATVQSLQLPVYTVAQANSLANTANGQIIYVSNGDSGQPCLAVYSVDAWKRVALGANIST